MFLSGRLFLSAKDWKGTVPCDDDGRFFCGEDPFSSYFSAVLVSLATHRSRTTYAWALSQLALVAELSCGGARGLSPPLFFYPDHGAAELEVSGAFRSSVGAAGLEIALLFCVRFEGLDGWDLDRVESAGRIGCIGRFDHVHRTGPLGCIGHVGCIGGLAVVDGRSHWGDVPIVGFESHHSELGRPSHLDGIAFDVVPPDLDVEAVASEKVGCTGQRPLVRVIRERPKLKRADGVRRGND